VVFPNVLFFLGFSGVHYTRKIILVFLLKRYSVGLTGHMAEQV
jgi:hypothetical protein